MSKKRSGLRIGGRLRSNLVIKTCRGRSDHRSCSHEEVVLLFVSRPPMSKKRSGLRIGGRLRSNLVIKTCRGRPDHRSCSHEEVVLLFVSRPPMSKKRSGLRIGGRLRSNLVIKTCRGRPDHRSCFPPSGCPARQHEPALRYRQSDLLRFYMTSETFQLRCDHVRQHGRSQSCCIGVYEEKSGSSLSSPVQSLMNGWIDSSIFQISPFGPRP